MLRVENLKVAYGHIEVLKGINFNVEAAEIVALIGSNGAGKTTTLNTISGLLRPTSGVISWKGENINRTPVEAIVASGLAHCPEGRRIFPGLTVRENLLSGTAARPNNRKAIEEDMTLVFDLFPRLKERIKQLGWSLSGGEQQMLAIGRALMSRPSLLMLDEPSLGLAPIVIDQLFDRIVELNKRTQLAVFLVEQNSAMALEIANRAFVIETGTITLSGPASELAGNPRIQEAYLGG
ncbi:ABC transporter ATP-binding protein [Bradyrhizobium sp. dw_78]|uniref:ABC transporter ATP-binding protein n=1 Tax=Bradyrhizobium sp. dw_78 TaxID=2719793 RepID=UPI001BD415AA|nr:ABC transporter ATP-binding protein [Bradyrhizobium sp. dw_78]